MPTTSSNQGAREVYGAVEVIGGSQASSEGLAPASASIGTGGTDQVVAANADRRGLLLVNVSTAGQRISLHFANGTAVLDSGVTLQVGDFYAMDSFSFTTARINAISSAASGVLGVQEFE
jgi:hypothetical protein